jgi:hypothetical protein
MTRAGRCEQCGTTVWLRADGTCLSGHPASGITEVHEVDPAPLADSAEELAAAGARRKRRTIVIAAIVVVVLVACAGVIGLLAVLINGAVDLVEQSMTLPLEGYSGVEGPEGTIEASDSDWMTLMSCPTSGTVSFEGELTSADLETEWGLPVAYVRTQAKVPSEEGREVVVAVKIPMDAEFLDASGASIRRYDFLKLLEDLPFVAVEVEQISGEAWATRMRLLE